MTETNKIEENFWDYLHESDGICGHCKKNKCAGKIDNSVLPNHIPTTSIVQAWKKIKGVIQ